MEVYAITILLLFVYPYAAIVYVLLESGAYIELQYRVYYAVLMIAVSVFHRVQAISGASSK